MSSIFFLKRLENTTREKRGSFCLGRKINKNLYILSSLLQKCMSTIFTLRNGGEVFSAFQMELKITFLFLVKRMKSIKYSMEFCYRSPWVSNKFINDSSRNWILTKLSDHIWIPISYLNALLSGLLARIERMIHFGCMFMACVI